MSVILPQSLKSSNRRLGQFAVTASTTELGLMAAFATHYQLDRWAHLGIRLKIGETYALEELERRAREMGGSRLLTELHKLLSDPHVFRPAPL